MKLYTMAGTCAFAPNVAIAWTNAPIEVVNLKRGEHKSEAYLALNPKGQVPALVFDDGDVLTEATAILDYISALDGDPTFAPGTVLHRKEAEALSYLSSEVHADFKGHFFPSRYADSPQGEKAVRHKTYAKLDAHFKRLDAKISETDSPWLLSERSFADGYLYIVMRWIERTPLNLEDYPNLMKHQQVMEQEDAVQTALKRQGMKPAG